MRSTESVEWLSRLTPGEAAGLVPGRNRDMSATVEGEEVLDDKVMIGIT